MWTIVYKRPHVLTETKLTEYLDRINTHTYNVTVNLRLHKRFFVRR